MNIWDNFKLEGFNVSEIMFQSMRAKYIIEDTILETLPFSDFETGFDDYDSSMEIYVKNNVEKNLTVTVEQMKPLFDFGFSRIWVNYNDKTEQYCEKDKVWERRNK